MYDKPNTETVKQMHLVHFKKTVASVYITVMVSSLLVFCVFQVRAENIWFNPSLLEVGDSTVDEKTVQRLAEGKLLPGSYLVDIYVNNMFIGKQDTVLTSDGPDESLTPSWSVNTLLGIGIKEDVLSENPQINMSSEVRDRTVPGILNSLPGTHSRLDLGKQRLDVTIPSIFMNRNLAGATPLISGRMDSVQASWVIISVHRRQIHNRHLLSITTVLFFQLITKSILAPGVQTIFQPGVIILLRKAMMLREKTNAASLKTGMQLTHGLNALCLL
nr:Uncharacterised protein [Enterobacter ludwigii]